MENDLTLREKAKNVNDILARLCIVGEQASENIVILVKELMKSSYDDRLKIKSIMSVSRDLDYYLENSIKGYLVNVIDGIEHPIVDECSL